MGLFLFGRYAVKPVNFRLSEQINLACRRLAIRFKSSLRSSLWAFLFYPERKVNIHFIS